MLLGSELQLVRCKFSSNIEKITSYAGKLKASGQYSNFETRLVFDCLCAFVGTEVMCEWYERYGCTDKNIISLGRKVLKELKVI